MTVGYYRTTQAATELERMALSVTQGGDPSPSYKEIADKICSVCMHFFSSCFSTGQDRDQLAIERRPLSTQE